MKSACLIVLLFLFGCASVKYDAGTGSFSYWRFGDQRIEGLKVAKDGEKIKVGLDEQVARNEEIAEILKIVRQLLERIP